MVRVLDLVRKFRMEIICGEESLEKELTLAQITRPGLELAGMFDFYEPDRVQLLGSKEVTFFWWLNESDQHIRVRMLFEKNPPAFVFSKHVDVPQIFIDLGREYNVPVLKSQTRTNELFALMFQYLNDRLAERTSVHGTLLDINGVGVLIRGKSGIGKSEVALELIRRGHQLVADDRVDIFARGEDILVGEAPELLQKFLEIRGIGIVNVVKLFGASAFKDSKKIMVIVELVSFEQNNDYDRLGLEDLTDTILNIKVPLVKLPITAARNVSTLIEVAAMNARLKFLGTHMAKEFTDQLTEAIEKKHKAKKV